MCYAKPGPRCSRHAKQKLSQAKQNYANTPSLTNKFAYAEARLNYYGTPKGQQELDDKLSQETNSRVIDALQRMKQKSLEHRAKQMFDYKQVHGERASDGTNKALAKDAVQHFLAKGSAGPGQGSYDDYYAATNKKHFLAEDASDAERASFLSGPGSQFDPEKVTSIQHLMGKLYERSPEHLATGDDRQAFIDEGADPNSFLPFCRYLKADGLGGYVGSEKTENLDDDTPLDFSEKSPGSNIISFVVEKEEKPYVDYSTVIIGPADEDGITNADKLTDGMLWTAFPGQASRQDPERKNRSKEEQAEHDKWVHEQAKRLKAEGRLTVGNVRNEIMHGREFDCNVRVSK